jgi:hypothetical protein
MSSPVMWGEEPTPPEPKLSLLPDFFASATNSLKVCAGNDGWTIISSGVEPSSETGAKSFIVS